MNKRLWIAGAVVGVFIIWGIISLSRGKQSSQDISNPSSLSAKEMFDQAVLLEQKNEVLKSKELYRRIMSESPDFRDISEVQKKSEHLNMRIIFSGIETPQTTMHEVVKGDSLGKIAKNYNTTVALIKKSNGLKSDTIRIGQKLRIWKGSFSLYVDKSQNMLMLKSDGEVVKVYTISTGANNITPIGNFTVVNKLVDPVWFKSGAIIPPESPKNILGTRWLGFDIPGYGIHGTTDPNTLGQQITAGCVRMRNSEVEELYDLLPIGAQVTVVD